MASLSGGSSSGAVGLDIGTDHIRLAQLRPSGGGFALQRYGVIGLPLGSGVEGEIVDADAVGTAIRDLMRSVGVRSGANVAAGVSNQKVVVRLIDLPYMDPAELGGAIQYQAQDYIPIPVEEAILDYQVIGDYMTSSDEHMMEVLLVAAQRDMIDQLVSAVDHSGLKLSIIDVTSFAIVRGLLGVSPEVLPGEADGEATAIIQMSAGITNIVVVEKGVPRFTRVSSVAANDFTQAVANSLNTTFAAAEDLKLRVGLPAPDGTSGVFAADIEPDLARNTQEALEREVTKFIAEVRRSLDYYLTQTSSVRAIKRVLLTGSGAQLRNLDSYVARGLQATVELADSGRFVQVPPNLQALFASDRLGATA
ncbi:MAG TPA: type IV pilus assembly protein PilM, partial [Coriobacteriia bacterium]